MVIFIDKIVVLVEETIIKEEVITEIHHLVVDLTKEAVVILEEVYIFYDALYYTGSFI
jgi:hypothetical protein